MPSPLRHWTVFAVALFLAQVACSLEAVSGEELNTVQFELTEELQRLPPVDDLLEPPTTGEFEQQPLGESFGQMSRPVPYYAEGGSLTIAIGDTLRDAGGAIYSDHQNFYSGGGLATLAIGFGAGAWLANSDIDQEFHDEQYRDRLGFKPGTRPNRIMEDLAFLGEGYNSMPLVAIAALAEPLIADLPYGLETSAWGRRSLRTYLVGGPAMLGLQLLTGGSRPSEIDNASHWRPFNDNNGVSGHAFVGAVPFLSAAKMAKNPWLKGGLYAASTLPALSRINDEDHFFSQAFLGWWVAYMAASAVDRTYTGEENRQFFVYPHGDGLGFAYQFRR